MNVRISRALPTRGTGPCLAEPTSLPCQSPMCLGRAGDACVLGAVERAGNTLYRARVYVELGCRLAHAHAVRKSRPDSLSRNRGGQSVGTISRLRHPGYVDHPVGRDAERSELKRAFCSSLREL